MRGGGGGGEEAGQKLKSMDVDKLENGGDKPALKYHGWRAMPFIIGTARSPIRSFSPSGGAGERRSAADGGVGGLGVQGTRRSRSWGRWGRRRTCWCT